MGATEFARTNELTNQDTSRGCTPQHDGHVDLPHPVRLIPLLLLATVSCSVGSADQSVSVAPPESCLTGKVFSVGTDFDPATILRLDDGEETLISGDREDEIRVLSGTVMTVCGELATDAIAESAIEAESFELLAVDGMTAYLGTLQEVDGSWQISRKGNDSLVPLSGVPEQLRGAEGSLVWVAGAWVDEAFSVRSFGILGGQNQSLE